MTSHSKTFQQNPTGHFLNESFAPAFIDRRGKLVGLLDIAKNFAHGVARYGVSTGNASLVELQPL